MSVPHAPGVAPFPPLSANALRVLEARYLRRDEHRRVLETPEEMFARVAGAVAAAEDGGGNAAAAEEEFHGLLRSLDFLPNSPTLMNAGTELGQLSACFVLPVPDSMEGIFEAVKRMALIQRTGGGTGFSFSRLRPRGDVVASTGGEASGPVSFIKVFDCATEHIKQGGKRRGANMGVLRVDHPDIMEFISAKSDGASAQNFNLSVGITDAFMNALLHEDRFELRHPSSGRVTGRVQARELFSAMVTAAWKTGDPGLLFLDTINAANPTPQLGEIEATNPCGEVPLLPHEACNLGSINLAHMLIRRDAATGVDWPRLRATAQAAVRFLDDVIEVSRFPFAEIEQVVRGNRKIGLGVMGFAEMLIRLGISYDSDAAVACAEEIMKFIADVAFEASSELARCRGAFLNWRGSIFERRGLAVRNATCTAVAPTGTIGIVAGTSASIEPLFALAYRRSHVLEGETLYEINPLLAEAVERYGLEVRAVIDEVREKGSLGQVNGVPDELKRLFVTALEIPAERHLEMQAAFQRHVDNSVSKTINLPESATPEDVARAYRRAWELRLKGITVYRCGSKAGQVIDLGLGEAAHPYDHGSRCDPDECRV